MQETVTVTGASPIVDTRETGTKSSFDLETMQNIPSARDPWVMLEKTPGIIMDRANVGGNQSGQQAGYISRGASTGNNKWSIDGVDITDMAATGSSPIYYDSTCSRKCRDTGGADVAADRRRRHQPVTKSGTIASRARPRALPMRSSSDKHLAELKAPAPLRAPIQNIATTLRLAARSQEQALVLGQLRRAGHQGRRRRFYPNTHVPSGGVAINRAPRSRAPRCLSTTSPAPNYTSS